jgi:cytochrome c-type biogenesis protein CcmF
VVRAKPGDVIEIAGREVTLLRVFERQGPNFQALTAELEYRDAASGRFIARLMPEKRVYTAERQTTTEAAIRPRPGGDDYAVLGDGDDRIGYSLRLYYKPLISWIWGGTALMALGGLVAMTGRRRQSTPNNSDIKTAADVKAMARGRA